MDILFLCKNQELSEKTAFILESQLLANVMTATNVEEGIAKLLEDSSIQLIICEDDVNSMMLFKYLSSINSKLPCMLIQDEGKDKKFEPFPELSILAVLNRSELGTSLPKAIKTAADKGLFLTTNSYTEYCRIHTLLLGRIAPLNADIYLKLSNIKYVKVLNAGATFTEEDHEKYFVKKKVNHLYIKRTDINTFISQFTKDIENSVVSEKLDKKTRIELTQSLNETIQDLSHTLGFTPEVQKLAKENVVMTLQTIGSSPKLSQMYSIIKRDRTKYLSTHSIMLAHVASAIAHQLEWPSKVTFTKLTFAALFHDLTLKNHRLAAISDLKELDEYATLFTPDEIDSYKKHPSDCAELLIKFPELPPDVDHIVRQHHEKPDGSGFPRGLTVSYIAPLSALFIVAHDLVHYILMSKGKIDIPSFVSSRKSLYNSGNFKKVLQVIAQTPIEESNP